MGCVCCDLFVVLERELVWQKGQCQRQGCTSHEQCRHEKMHLEHFLHILVFAHFHDVSSEEAREHAHHNARSRDEKGEHQRSISARHDFSTAGRDDESSTRSLGEGTEEIGAHACDITDVVTDVVGDGRWVVWRVFIEQLHLRSAIIIRHKHAIAVLHGDTSDFARKVSTDISSLGEDASTNTTEQSHGGSTKTIACDALEEHLGAFKRELVTCLREEVDDDEKHEKREAAQSKAHDRASNEGCIEGSPPALGSWSHSLHSDTCIGVHSHCHSKVSRDDGSDGTNSEGCGSQATNGEIPLVGTPIVGDAGREDQDDNGEDQCEHQAEAVLGVKEGLCSCLHVSINFDELREVFVFHFRLVHLAVCEEVLLRLLTDRRRRFLAPTMLRGDNNLFDGEILVQTEQNADDPSGDDDTGRG